MNQSQPNHSESWELLAGRVLGDLNEQETAEVDAMLAGDDESLVVLEELERAAAGVQLAMLVRADHPMPKQLADRISDEGQTWIGRVSGSVAPAASVELARNPGGPNRREWFAWLCAAAALLVAIGLWRSDQTNVATTASAARAELLRSADSLIRVDWGAGTTPFDQSVSGDVVWDPASQTGYMRFQNMPVNDPTVEQYQLWIIDPARDEEPIDGGVFNISDSGEVIVEIDAKLKVIDPAAFAITIEKPGGVVVSTQERLPLLAPVENS